MGAEELLRDRASRPVFFLRGGDVQSPLPLSREEQSALIDEPRDALAARRQPVGHALERGHGMLDACGPCAGHDPVLQLGQVGRRERLPGQRQQDAVLPFDVAPLVLEEAAQHVAQHLRVARDAGVGQQLQLVGQLVSEALVGGVLGLELLHDGAQRRPLGRAAPQQREQHVLLELQMRLEALAQDRCRRARDGPVEAGQRFGETLQQVAQLELEGVVLLDEREGIGTAAGCGPLAVRGRRLVGSCLP